MTGPLVVACGALATELRAVLDQLALVDVDVRFLPANLHNRPERIVPALDELVGDTSGRAVLVGYADCGTGGQLDAWLADHPGATRLPGAHCYETYAGRQLFHALHDAEPGTFYLTDYLAKHFDALVWQGLGLDRHPQLLPEYFGRYERVVLLSQSADPGIERAGRRAAERLGLAFAHRHVGLDRLRHAVAVTLSRTPAP
jgi:Protein of unknown function (DUF1638)